jgi:HSP20 family molecular chaperone IbpA
LSESDGFDRVFEDMIRLTQRLFETQPSDWGAEAQPEQEQVDRDELIERGDSFEYILEAPGYSEGQLLVTVQDDEIEVRGPDFVMSKALPSKVDPDSTDSKYTNGVLSVRVNKR